MHGRPVLHGLAVLLAFLCLAFPLSADDIADRPGWVSKDMEGERTLYFHKRLDNGLSKGIMNACAWKLYPVVVEQGDDLRLGIMFKYTGQRKRRINPETITFAVGPDEWTLEPDQFEVLKIKEPEGLFAPDLVRFSLLLEPETSRSIMDSVVKNKGGIVITLRQNLKEVVLEYPRDRHEDIAAFIEWAKSVME